MRKLILILFLSTIFLIGCKVTVQERDDFTIGQLKALRTMVKDVMTDAADNITDTDKADEVRADRDTVDIEFDGLITYEEAKENEKDD